MPVKALVLGTNILVRAVLGKRVREVIESHVEEALFFVPDIAFAEAEEHLPALIMKHHGDPARAIALLQGLRFLVEEIRNDVYGSFEIEAKKLLQQRDPEDWPILATALALGCPIWTEDKDFFGCGVATWTSRNIQMYLRSDR